jgi:hypothetical protein
MPHYKRIVVFLIWCSPFLSAMALPNITIVQCNHDMDCVNSSLGMCSNHTCVLRRFPCLTNLDCSGQQSACNPITFECVFAACVNDEHCIQSYDRSYCHDHGWCLCRPFHYGPHCCQSGWTGTFCNLSLHADQAGCHGCGGHGSCTETMHIRTGVDINGTNVSVPNFFQTCECRAELAWTGQNCDIDQVAQLMSSCVNDGHVLDVWHTQCTTDAVHNDASFLSAQLSTWAHILLVTIVLPAVMWACAACLLVVCWCQAYKKYRRCKYNRLLIAEESYCLTQQLPSFQTQHEAFRDRMTVQAQSEDEVSDDGGRSDTIDRCTPRHNGPAITSPFK